MYNDILENVDYESLLKELEEEMQKNEEKEAEKQVEDMGYQKLSYNQILKIFDNKKRDLYRAKYLETYEWFIKPLYIEASKYNFVFSRPKDNIPTWKLLKELSDFLRQKGYTDETIMDLVPKTEDELERRPFAC